MSKKIKLIITSAITIAFVVLSTALAIGLNFKFDMMGINGEIVFGDFMEMADKGLKFAESSYFLILLGILFSWIGAAISVITIFLKEGKAQKLFLNINALATILFYALIIAGVTTFYTGFISETEANSGGILDIKFGDVVNVGNYIGQIIIPAFACVILPINLLFNRK